MKNYRLLMGVAAALVAVVAVPVALAQNAGKTPPAETVQAQEDKAQTEADQRAKRRAAAAARHKAGEDKPAQREEEEEARKR